MALILIRHPETEQNQAKVFPDYTDAPYTKTGLNQLHAVLQPDFSVKHIYSSPLGRALRMAEKLGEKYDLEVVIDERLREIDLGHFAGLTYQEIERYYPDMITDWMADPWHFKYPAGESYPDLKHRVLEFMKHVSTDSIICTHQAVSQVIAAEFGDEEPLETGEWRVYED